MAPADRLRPPLDPEALRRAYNLTARVADDWWHVEVTSNGVVSVVDGEGRPVAVGFGQGEDAEWDAAGACAARNHLPALLDATEERDGLAERIERVEEVVASMEVLSRKGSPDGWHEVRCRAAGDFAARLRAALLRRTLDEAGSDDG